MLKTLIIIYLSISIFVFVIYGVDKKKSKKKAFRISENTLILLAFFGPLGAFFGMQLFRHKTKKKKFKIWISIFIIFHILITSLFMLKTM